MIGRNLNYILRLNHEINKQYFRLDSVLNDSK